MTAAVEKEFIERVRELLVALPYDLKALFEAMTDEDLSTDVRHLATSAVIYCLSPADPIPDHSGVVGFVDDVIAVRLVLKRLLEMGGEPMAGYPERFPEQFQRLDEDLELFRSYLGDAMSWLDERMRAENSKAMKYKGKTVETYVADDDAGQWLYEEGLEFTTEYELDDEAVTKLSSGKPVLEAFEKRRQFEASRKA